MIGIGADHGGYDLKNHIKSMLEKEGIECKDFGTYNAESVDYPDIAETVCKSIINGECECGILICGTGVGISIAANKIRGIRAAHVTDTYTAKMTKRHNNANVICLGGRITGEALAEDIVKAYLDAEFEGGRHSKRVDKITHLEENN